MNNLTVKFFNVGCGDAISIRFFGSDQKWCNILVDGGTQTSYPIGIKKEIEAIIERKENIDLWIITHIHTDHIGGVLRFIKEKRLKSKFDIGQIKFWFNYSNFDYEIWLKENGFVGVKQGIPLRDFLRQNSFLEEKLTNQTQPINFHGAKLTILSPDSNSFEQLLKLWATEETKIIKKKLAAYKSATANDYKTKVTEFNLANFTEDTNVENGSSIAFLFEYQQQKILFLSDSHPSVVAKSLEENLEYTNENKLVLNYMQVAHHGSKFNTSDKLLSLIDCSDYIISGDGLNKHNLPNKETLARIKSKNPNRKINFHITAKNRLTTSIFKVDLKENIEDIKLTFPPSNNNILTL